MEAFAGLGLACNILQLISCGLRIATLSKELREKGSTSRRDDIKENAARMAKISYQLGQQLESSSNRNEPVKDHADLIDLATRCKTTSDQLQLEVSRLILDSRERGRWKILLASTKSLLGQNNVQDLEKKLSVQCGQLQTELLGNIYLQQEVGLLQQVEGFTEIDRNLRKLVNDIASQSLDLSRLTLSTHTDLENFVRTEIERVCRTVNSVEGENLTQSLTFPEMNGRKNSIPASHEKTFNWIFNHTVQCHGGSFAAWLKNGEKTFWITGKAGSGKSCLMKFLFDHRLTTKFLSAWAAGERVIKLHFFIWRAGSTMQKQGRGLLCALLRQLFQQSPAFLSQTLQAEGVKDKREPADWSVEELSALIQEFTNTQPEKVCIFVDGLDESEDHHGDIGLIELMRWLQTLKNVKMCVSSRPEPELRGVLAQCPQLTLQDHTKKDLRNFTIDKLQEVGRVRFPGKPDETAILKQLIEAVLAKADGVFLWVRVALTSIICDIHRMEDWDEVMRWLGQLPSELTALYTDIWQRNTNVLERHRKEAGRYFQLTLATQETGMTCFELMVATSDVARKVFESADYVFSREQLLEECQRIERRMLNCTMGLLEIRETRRSNQFCRSGITIQSFKNDSVAAELARYRGREVSFIHRTAMEFIQKTSTGREILGVAALDDQDIQRSRLQALAIAPFCEFPVVDQLSLNLFFKQVHDIKVSGHRGMAFVKVFERLHGRLAAEHSTPSKFDVLRDWTDSVRSERWEVKVRSDLLLIMRPYKYAVGWRSYAAAMGMRWYFEQELLSTCDRKLSHEYATCLAMCAATPLPGNAHHAQRLQTVNFMAEKGADLNARLPLFFSEHSPTIDIYSLFFSNFLRRGTPVSESEREEMFLQLRTAATHVRCLSNTSIHAIELKHDNVAAESRQLCIYFPQGSHFRKILQGHQRKLWIVKLNVAALIQLCCSSLHASPAEISTILTERSGPQCSVLATKMGSKGFRALAGDSDSTLFYRHLLHCGDQFPFMNMDVKRLRRRSQAQDTAITNLLKAVEEIESRATTSLDLDELLASEGYWHSEPITTEDVPFLDPFGENGADCSRFVFKPRE